MTFDVISSLSKEYNLHNLLFMNLAETKSKQIKSVKYEKIVFLDAAHHIFTQPIQLQIRSDGAA